MGVGKAVKIAMSVNSSGVASGLRKVNTDLRKFERVAKSTMNAARTPLQQYQLEVVKLDRWLAKGKITTKQYAAAMANLGVTYAAVIPAATATGRAIQLIGVHAKVTAVAVKGLVASLGFLGPMAAIFGAFRVGSNVEGFNQAMTSSLAIATDVSKKMRAVMEKTAHDVAKRMVFSSEEVAKSYYYLFSAGMDAAQAVAAVDTVATFAQSGMFDLATATSLLTDAQKALGVSSKDPIKNLESLRKIASVLVKANTLADASVQEFAEALTTDAAPAMKQWGISLEEGMAILAAFAEQGDKGAAAGTAFGIVIRDLTTRAIKNKEAFNDLGIQRSFDAQGNFIGPIKSIRALDDAFEELSPEKMKETLLTLGFMDKSVKKISKLMGENDSINGFKDAMTGLGDVVGKVAAKQLTPFAKGWERLSASWTEFSTATVTDSLNSFGGVLVDVARKVEKLVGWIEDLNLAYLKMVLWNSDWSVSLSPGAAQTEAWANRALRDEIKIMEKKSADRRSPGLSQVNRQTPVVQQTGQQQLAELKKLNTRMEAIEDKLEPDQEVEIQPR